MPSIQYTYSQYKDEMILSHSYFLCEKNGDILKEICENGALHFYNHLSSIIFLSGHIRFCCNDTQLIHKIIQGTPIIKERLRATTKGTIGGLSLKLILCDEHPCRKILNWNDNLMV